MRDRALLRAVTAAVLVAAACSSDAAEEVREDASDGLETTSGDSVIDAVPIFPGDSVELDNSGGVSPNAPQPGAVTDGGGTSGATRPAGTPPASIGREGAGPPGGDNLGSRQNVGQTSSTNAILTRAAEAYAAVRTLRADFEQSTENPVLRRTTTSRGTIFQARPDRFLMRFSQPEGDRIVADGQYIWVYYPSIDAQQVIRMRAGAGGAGGVDLQAQFLGDPTTRFDATHQGVESVGGRAADVLVLTPRSAGNFRTLKVWVDQRDHLVRRFEITEHNGVIRRFLLRNLTPGADVEDSLFRFTPPEGAHVVARG